MGALEDEVMQEYLAECREHLTGIEADLLEIEQAGDKLDEERVNKVFRAAHSIKGGAGFFDLNKIRALAHKTENVLDLIRSHQAHPDPEMINTLLLAFDKLREMIGDPAASEQDDISGFLEKLEAMAAASLPQRRKSSLHRNSTFYAGTRQTRLSATTFDFDAARKSGKQVYLLEYDLLSDIQRRNRKPMEVIKELMRFGVLLDTAFDLEAAGTLDESPSSRLLMDVLYASALGPDLIGTVVDIPAERTWIAARNGSCQALPIVAGSATAVPELEELETPPQASEPFAPAPLAPELLPQEEAVGTPQRLGPLELGGGDATVRLHVSVLDSLMNLAGELVLGRNQLNDAVARTDMGMIQAASQRIGAVTAEVQDAVMRTRMQPVSNLFQKFPRLVRDTARKLDKQVQLLEEGGDVELDKTIIERLSDPLTHLVRNAIDHGIETPDVRAAAAKPPMGTVSLRAWHEAGMVVVEASDDGRGLDAGKIASSAMAKGLVGPEAASMSSDEKMALVFLPGLSTAPAVTDISGRGVGLDVVKTNLDQLGGTIQIVSEVGKGAAFRIKLPLTLAIIPSLLVSSDSDRMAIPLANVQELVRIPASEAARRIERVGSASVLMLRDGVVPLVDLGRVLGFPDDGGEGDGAAMNLVVLTGGAWRYGLVVKRLHGTVDIVVKPLGAHIKHLREYAGATILGDGCVALILDVAGLAEVGRLAPQSGRKETAVVEGRSDSHQLLMFRNSPREACAVPLPAVARVFKLRPEEVENVGGRRSVQHRGRNLPLVMLADLASVDETPAGAGAIVVVLEAGGCEFGLLGTRPVDVIETSAEIDPYTLRQPGVAGSVILHGGTALVLEPAELAGAACPQAKAERAAPDGPAVLVVDDSAFFREQVVRTVENAGWRTLAARDGQAAVEILEQDPAGIGLVITDVEMPRLDGIELTRKIRACARTAELPVIMLTSLAAEEDRRRGRTAGATEYCVKADCDQLLGMVREVLALRPPRPGRMESALSELSRRLHEESAPAKRAGTLAGESK